MKTTIQNLKGFRDFLPADMAFQNWFYQNLKEVSQSYGFQEYEGPTVEPLDLYAAKSGEELVKKQAFTFEDKSGKTVALRPEMTPTLARMISQNENDLTFPVKWFTYGRRFRYESPQKGRGREFFQWDIDILGPDNPEADGEIITIAVNFYQKLKLTPSEVKIKINDRKYLESRLKEIGIPDENISPLFKIIDKKDKVDEKIFKEMIKDLSISDGQIDGISEILSDKKGYEKSDWLKSIYFYLDRIMHYMQRKRLTSGIYGATVWAEAGKLSLRGWLALFICPDGNAARWRFFAVRPASQTVGLVLRDGR